MEKKGLAFGLLKIAVEKKFIRDLCKSIKRKWLKIWRTLDFAIARFVWKIFVKKIPTQKNQIMFRTYQNKYTCNPKYLCEQLIKENVDCKIVWAYAKSSGDLTQFPPQVELVKFGTFDYYYAVAQSKYWIDNAHNFTWEAFPKKDDQVLINLWHGSLGLKRINPEADSNRQRRKAGKLAGTATNYCVTDSDFEEEVFRTSYWPETPFLKYGHTRNDIMFTQGEELAAIKKKVFDYFGIEEGKKILLYAPTFRDDPDETECFDIDYDLLKKTLEKRFGGEWVILSRLHMHTQKAFKKKLRYMPSHVISADTYDDMQELIAATDIGITDYSSWICDFVLSGRPGFLFTTDIDSYVDERGFYYPLETTPFPIAKSNKELIDNIVNFDAEAYETKRKQYLDGLGCIEDGRAAERIVEFLRKDMAK